MIGHMNLMFTMFEYSSLLHSFFSCRTFVIEADFVLSAAGLGLWARKQASLQHMEWVSQLHYQFKSTARTGL